MNDSFHPVVLIALVAAIIAVVTIVIALPVGVPLRPSAKGALMSALPSLLMLVFFYSLAFHMYRSLGVWPAGIGEAGFSHMLKTHAYVATNYMAFLLLVTVFAVFAWPIAFLLYVLVRRWRVLVSYLGIHALSFVVSWCLFRLAPSQFLYWWWD
jgi:hypothetical protein